MALTKCGGAWIKTSKKGGKFLSVSFEPEGRNGKKYSFMLFRNEFDEDNPQGKKPDYSCMMSDGEDDRSRASDPDDSPF